MMQELVQEQFQNTINESLDNFLVHWQSSYIEKIDAIPLFNVNETQRWSQAQRENFVRTFYHIRGHFQEFLWFLGNHAPNKDIKKIVIQNISEEFSLDGISHEKLYLAFAKSVGVDLRAEILKKENNLVFINKFNQQHLEWLVYNDWDHCFSAFSAYEKLDNIDYVRLYKLAESFGLERKDLIFFSVHKHVNHFDITRKYLMEIWDKNMGAVKTAFNFITENQVEVWTHLSNEISRCIG